MSRHAPRRSLPWIVLAASLALTAAAAAVVGTTGRARDEARFANAANLTLTRIDSRLRTYVTMLRGAAGLFAASGEVTPAEFRTFVATFAVGRQYRGVQGVGFARRVRQSELAAFTAAWRPVAGAEFQVWPVEPPRPDYFPIVMLEPLDWRNQRAMGFDMFADSVRRQAMARARDAGVPVLSGRVTLVQETLADAQPGFLLYLPVYEGGGVPATVAERRARLRGFVYAPFRAPDLFAELDSAGLSPVSMAVYDGRGADSARLLHDNAPPRRAHVPAFTRTDSLAAFGRWWTVHLSSRPAVEERPARLLAPAIAVMGILVSVLLFVVTRREVRARAAAERSEQERGRFYAAMSHELRTPLNAIMGYNDLLLAGLYGPLDAPQHSGIERSQRAARHLLELVNDVLDLSKLEAGKMEITPSPVELPALVEELFATVRGLADARGSALHLQCDGTLPPVVTDARRVRQILLNLLSNAIRFGEGRPITVRCAPARHGGACVAVTDHGTGIAPEDQERIFEEFVQLPNAGEGGTGLGLPISRRLARLLGGRLRVESAVGRGSTFTLELPREMGPG